MPIISNKEKCTYEEEEISVRHFAVTHRVIEQGCSEKTNGQCKYCNCFRKKLQKKFSQKDESHQSIKYTPPMNTGSKRLTVSIQLTSLVDGDLIT